MESVKVIHDLVWGPWLLLLFLGTGIFYTFKLKGFQIFHFRYWWKSTAGTLGNRDEEAKSQIATACTALAATVGTGKHCRSGDGYRAGGPGAVFWMWVSAFVGMAATYGETYLGIRYRYRGTDGQYICGPFVYLEQDLKKPRYRVALCVLLCPGVIGDGGAWFRPIRFQTALPMHFPAAPDYRACGNGSHDGGGFRRNRKNIGGRQQAGTVFGLPLHVLCGIVIFSCYDKVPGVFSEIVREAFNFKSAAGGAARVRNVKSAALRCGKRGILQ